MPGCLGIVSASIRNSDAVLHLKWSACLPELSALLPPAVELCGQKQRGPRGGQFGHSAIKSQNRQFLPFLKWRSFSSLELTNHLTACHLLWLATSQVRHTETESLLPRVGSTTTHSLLMDFRRRESERRKNEFFPEKKP